MSDFKVTSLPNFLKRLEEEQTTLLTLLEITDLVTFNEKEWGIKVNNFVRLVSTNIMHVPGGKDPR
jgi:hypothetical protein